LLQRIREERDLANIGNDASGLRQDQAGKNEPRQTPLAGSGRKSQRRTAAPPKITTQVSLLK
jgi:hypothetical protein